jgi:hypothetical protein
MTDTPIHQALAFARHGCARSFKMGMRASLAVSTGVCE